MGQWLTRAERMQVIHSGLIHEQAKTGETLYFVSPHCLTLLRIYDKRLELQAKRRYHRALMEKSRTMGLVKRGNVWWMSFRKECDVD